MTSMLGMTARVMAVAAMTMMPAVRPFAQAPTPSASSAVALAVGGDVPHAISLTPADLKAMPRTTVTVSEEGREVKYGLLSYPSPNTGLYEITKRPEDVGKFRAPTLRNIAVTAPYMHDGSIATLDEVIEHYAAGGRTLADGPYHGVGHDNPNKSPVVRGFTLTTEQKSDLIAFLRALTDTNLLDDPRWANPWTRQPKEIR